MSTGSSYDTTAVLDETGHVVWTHWCRGEQVEATLPNTGWRVVQAEPLSVEPSVACDRCGWHGTITDGQPWPIHAAQSMRSALIELDVEVPSAG